MTELSAWLWAALLPLSPLLLVLSAMLERSGPIRLRHWVEEAGGRLKALYDQRARFEVFRFLLSFAAKTSPVILFFAAAAAGRRLDLAMAEVLALALTAAVVAAAEMTIRVLVGHDPEEALRRLTGLYQVARLALWPLVLALWPLVPLHRLERREEPEDQASDEEIDAFIDVGTREGILEPGEGDLVRGIVDLGETQVKSVMTPRIDMICAPVTSSLEELAARFIESKHSRIPVYHQSVDQIVGVVSIRDLLQALRADHRPSTWDLAKPTIFVPETRALDSMLRELQTRRLQMAIVVDEYGGTSGLVTLEDLLEEIFGDIMDEDEELESEPEPLPGGGWRLDGGTHLEDLEELLGVEIPEGPYETVGGMIFSRLGYVPEPGESVEANGLRFTVEGVADRRIQTVRVEEVAAAPGGEREDRAS